MSALFRSPLIIIDTETTGLLSDPEATPWEIAAVLLDVDGQEADQYDFMGCPSPWRDDMARIVALGGIEPAQVLAARPLAEQLPDFRQWLERRIADGARPTAFNIAFDWPMLRRVDVHLVGDAGAPCIMEAAKKAMGRAGALPWMQRYGDWKMPKLSEAASFYGVPQQEPAHRALADARTAGLIAVAMQRRALAAREAQ